MTKWREWLSKLPTITPARLRNAVSLAMVVSMAIASVASMVGVIAAIWQAAGWAAAMIGMGGAIVIYLWLVLSVWQRAEVIAQRKRRDE